MRTAYGPIAYRLTPSRKLRTKGVCVTLNTTKVDVRFCYFEEKALADPGAAVL